MCNQGVGCVRVARRHGRYGTHEARTLGHQSLKLLEVRLSADMDSECMCEAYSSCKHSAGQAACTLLTAIAAAFSEW